MPDDNYPGLRSGYYEELFSILNEYLGTDRAKVTAYRNRFKRAVNTAFWPAFEMGYEAGGSALPLDPASFDWILARTEEEYTYVDGLFERMRDEVKPTGDHAAFLLELGQRAENYCKTLDGIYSIGMVRGAGDKLLTFLGSDGKNTCATCQRWKGKRKKASFWIAHNLVPYPGNEAFICKCFFCQHYLVDALGNVFTL